jgi:hypothetical protein
MVEALCYKPLGRGFDSPMRLLDFSVDLILLAALSPCGEFSLLTQLSARNLPRGEGQSACKADNLTAICEPIF